MDIKKKQRTSAKIRICCLKMMTCFLHLLFISLMKQEDKMWSIKNSKHEKANKSQVYMLRNIFQW
jgi:hypothetical protein